MTILEACETGTRRDVLVALRDHIARVIDDNCSARDLVGLSRRLVDIVQEIERIDATEEPLLRVVPEDGPFAYSAI